MAGVKGRSGGARPGAGRKPRPTVAVDAQGRDTLALLEDIAFGRIEASLAQVAAAKSTLPYKYAKVGEGGKKEKKQAEAEKVAGRFTAAAPPRLATKNGKQV